MFLIKTTVQSAQLQCELTIEEIWVYLYKKILYTINMDEKVASITLERKQS